jgi:hypothetical protein
MHDLVTSLVTVVLFVAGNGGGAANVAPAEAGPTPTPTRSSAAVGPAARHVTEHLCDTYDYRPGQITVACGDGNAQVVHLRWPEWTTARAVGVGTWRQNDCKPNCAAGTFHDYPVRLALTDPMHTGPRRIFGRVIANFPGKAPPVPAYRSGHAVLMDRGRQPDQVLRTRHRGKLVRGLGHHPGRPRADHRRAAPAGGASAGGHPQGDGTSPQRP